MGANRTKVAQERSLEGPPHVNFVHSDSQLLNETKELPSSKKDLSLISTLQAVSSAAPRSSSTNTEVSVASELRHVPFNTLGAVSVVWCGRKPEGKGLKRLLQVKKG